MQTRDRGPVRSLGWKSPTDGIAEQDVERITQNCRGSSMKTNPVVLTDDEIAGIVRARL